MLVRTDVTDGLLLSLNPCPILPAGAPAGNAPLPQTRSYSQCYGGHQFGHWCEARRHVPLLARCFRSPSACAALATLAYTMFGRRLAGPSPVAPPLVLKPCSPSFLAAAGLGSWVTGGPFAWARR